MVVLLYTDVLSQSTRVRYLDAEALGEDDGLDASPESLLGNGQDEIVELFQGMVIGDEHR